MMYLAKTRGTSFLWICVRVMTSSAIHVQLSEPEISKFQVVSHELRLHTVTCCLWLREHELLCTGTTEMAAAVDSFMWLMWLFYHHTNNQASAPDTRQESDVLVTQADWPLVDLHREAVELKTIHQILVNKPLDWILNQRCKTTSHSSPM